MFSDELSSWYNFPDLAGTVWKWADNGLNCKCRIQFLQDKSLKVNKKCQKHESYWKLKNYGKVLEAKFHGSIWELKYIPEDRKAVVINSDISPISAMWG